MYRLQFHFEAVKGQAGEAIAATERLRDIARERGWREATLWHVSFGPYNHFVEETEYDNLTQYEAETAAQQDEAAFTALLRARSDVVVPGSGRRELLERI